MGKKKKSTNGIYACIIDMENESKNAKKKITK
jgi:hypothetical protein